MRTASAERFAVSFHCLPADAMDRMRLDVPVAPVRRGPDEMGLCPTVLKHPATSTR